MEAPKANIWEGIYHNISDIPCDYIDKLNPNSDIDWEDMLFNSTIDYFKHFNALVNLESDLAPLIVASYVNLRKQLTLLDIGGAMGIHNIQMRTLGLNQLISRHIILEVESVCKKANELRSTSENVNFMYGFPDSITPFNVDVVYMNSSVQYIIPYEAVLKKIVEFNPTFICFERSYFGDFSTFYSLQCNMKKNLVVQMLNKAEIINCLDKLNYRVLLEVKKDWPERWYTGNFPDEYNPGKDYPLFIFVNKTQDIKHSDFIATYEEYKKNGLLSLLR